jgi:hypothetical protein
MSRPGKDVSALVELDNIAKPIRVRFRADQHEYGRCGDLLLVTGAQLLQRESFQVGLPAAVRHACAQLHIKIWGLL